ncbi:Fe-S cluster assembly protein SufD [Flavihumibacter fluvii]|uniref:Fe-S cluster assembly protein SufD n=1 Tax=Flavihumibacter fluvii TaxID=2838157 RepID=UPI001BDE4755|nr:Fe-S cluster assembly protein SufD [Flavihumibacter fluvii]ULQ52967.1 Fe-S cluster assembly protein SufD [Flavihumibacter fluvii]
MNTSAYFKEQFDLLRPMQKDNTLSLVREKAFDTFNRLGIPNARNEEWKYTHIGGLFNKEYQFPQHKATTPLSIAELAAIRLPGHENASELFFINGLFSAPHSAIRSASLEILPLEEAGQHAYSSIVSKYFGGSSNYQKDGIHALNTAFIQGAVFIHVKKSQSSDHPVYIYNISDTRPGNILSQPRSLLYISEQAQVQVVENYTTLGLNESFTNQVMEIIVEKDAMLEYYKIQNDSSANSQVSTTHIHQVGKSYVHTVTISLNGGIVRNNLHAVMDAEHAEAHAYGLYLQNGHGHLDNHTVVDHIKPNCFSNEFYKGILDGHSTGVFNGKIFVRPQAQKTNAFQSNKNILLSGTASINSKPQLEIFADDVKCSHGCTVGRLDDEGLFYLQSRGISEKIARSLLLQAFGKDIIAQVKPEPVRAYVDALISERLQLNLL